MLIKFSPEVKNPPITRFWSLTAKPYENSKLSSASYTGFLHDAAPNLITITFVECFVTMVIP